MNFLAHLYLSGENTSIQAGNLFGDEIKGKDYTYLPKDIAKGVTLHRFIDNHADTDLANLELKKVLYETFHKYAGVALDIYFDHFLAKNWANFHESELENFAAQVYLDMPEHLSNFSAHSHKLFSSMSKMNWLAGYGTLEGMGKTFTGMSKILPENSGMNRALEALEKHYTTLEAGFEEYFPRLRMDSHKKLLALS